MGYREGRKENVSKDVSTYYNIIESKYMGFNVSVHSNVPNESECHHFVDRSYYVFAVTYETFEAKSVVVRLGEVLGLNLTPLGRLVHDFNINPAKKYWQDTETITKLIKDLIEKLQVNPAIADEISIPYPQDDDFFREYIRSGELSEHLTEILRTIKCLVEKGATSVFFLAQ